MAVKRKTRKKRRFSITLFPKELLRKLPGSKLMMHAAGTVILGEGTRATTCYLITSGKVRILKRNKKGENISLGLAKPGEFIGEMAMLSGKRRSASAVALTPVEAIVIDHARFVALLREQHPFASRLNLQLATLLAARCDGLLRLIAHRPEITRVAVKKAPPVDTSILLNRVFPFWGI